MLLLWPKTSSGTATYVCNIWVVIGLKIRKRATVSNWSNRNTKIGGALDTPMDRLKKVKRGDWFLPDIGLPEPEQPHRKEPHGKTRTMLQAATLRKKGEILESTSNAIGVAISTACDWLQRLEDGGLERRHDCKSPGRPCRLSDEQLAAPDRDVDKDPTESGFFCDAWTSRLVARRILDSCGIKYSDSGALKLTRRMNFSVRGVRHVPYSQTG